MVGSVCSLCVLSFLVVSHGRALLLRGRVGCGVAKRGFGNPPPGGKSPGKLGKSNDDAAAAAAAAAAAGFSFDPPLLMFLGSPMGRGDNPSLFSLLFKEVGAGDLV